MATLIMFFACAPASIGAQVAATRPAIQPASTVQPGAVLLCFLDKDPTPELAEKVPLSPPQIEFAQACYAEYRASLQELAERAWREAESIPDWPRREALLPAEKARLIAVVHRTLRPFHNEAAELERAMFEKMQTVVAEAQHPTFRRTQLAISRRLWLGSRANPQDFIQLPDPIELLLSQVALLAHHPEAAAAMEELARETENALDGQCSAWAIDRNALRQEVRAARASQDEKSFATAMKRYARDWVEMYQRLSNVVLQAAVVLESAGESENARRLKEQWWQNVFPDLLGRDQTAHSLDVIDMTTLDAERSARIAALKVAYFARRHQLLREIVGEYVSDFRQSTASRSSEPLGLTSVRIVKAQIERCKMSINARKELESAQPMGSLSQQLDDGRLDMDREVTLQYLQEALAVLEGKSYSNNEGDSR